MKVQEKLALQCVLMALESRVIPKRDETASEFAHRLHGIGSGILSEMLMEAAEPDDDGGESDPVYSEDDDQSEEFEPEETLTDETQEAPIRVVETQDGEKEWYWTHTKSAPFPKLESCPNCEKSCSSDKAEEVFGFRNMTVATGVGQTTTIRRRQSWCRECRLAALKQNVLDAAKMTAQIKADYEIPAGMPPADFVKMFRVLSKGRSPLQVWMKNQLLVSKFGEVTFTVVPKKPD